MNDTLKLQDLPDGFELDHLELALSYVTNWRTAVDGGACTGIWTREMAKKFERVIAFEPVAVNRARIQLRANVEVRAAALGAEAGVCSMHNQGDNIGMWQVTEGADVSVQTLDAMRLNDLDYLKLDLEGYELYALQGARETIGRCRPVILLEEKWHSRDFGIPVGAATAYLESMGAQVVARIGRDVICAW